MTAPEVRELLERSHRLGADPRNTNWAGGNASCKGLAADPVTGRPVELRESKGLPADPYRAFAASGYAEKVAAERIGGTQASWGA